MTAHFLLANITDLKTATKDTILPESDFSLLDDGKFYQFTLVEDDKGKDKYSITPGTFAISMRGNSFVLVETNFTKENVMTEYVNTKVVTDKIDKFFSKIDVYRELGMFPRRAALLYGSAGTGKSALITKVCTQYAAEKDTVVVIWPTDKYEARHVKDFLKSFQYSDDTKKLLLVMEDLGGVEAEGRGKHQSDSGLLSLLDNVEQSFTIPTMILATTNFPENFLENLTDRPQRFDDVIEVKRPEPEFRAKFLEFFSNGKIEITEAMKAKIKEKQYETFSIAHIKEVIVRAIIYDITVLESLDQVQAQSAKAKNDFTNKKKMGF